MLHASQGDQPFLQPPADQASVSARPGEELAGLVLELSWRAAFASARRARACAFSEETFGCNERMRRWFFA